MRFDSKFRNEIGAEGDFEASLAEWSVAYNAMPPEKPFLERAVRKAIRTPTVALMDRMTTFRAMFHRSDQVS